MIDLVEEQPDVDIQHDEYQPINDLEPADEPPNFDMDDGNHHQLVKSENLLLPQNAKPSIEENALLPEAIEPLEPFKEEYDSLIANKTGTCPCSPGWTSIKCKWIGKVEPACNSIPERYKGKLVAMGSKHKYGVDYDDVFAPVPRQAAVKAAFA